MFNCQQMTIINKKKEDYYKWCYGFPVLSMTHEQCIIKNYTCHHKKGLM